MIFGARFSFQLKEAAPPPFLEIIDSTYLHFADVSFKRHCLATIYLGESVVGVARLSLFYGLKTESMSQPLIQLSLQLTTMDHAPDLLSI